MLCLENHKAAVPLRNTQHACRVPMAVVYMPFKHAENSAVLQCPPTPNNSLALFEIQDTYSGICYRVVCCLRAGKLCILTLPLSVPAPTCHTRNSAT